MNKQIENYYESYWRHRIKTGKVYKDVPIRIQRTVAHISHMMPQSILDIACGEGVAGKEIKKANKHHHVTGVDISSTALRLAKANYDQVIRTDITQKKDQKKIVGKFDTIISLEVIEHVLEPEELIHFAHEHLNKAGKFIVSFPNTAWWKYRLDLLQGRFIDESPTYTSHDHIQFYTLNSLTKLLNRQGFSVQSIDGDFKFPWYFGRLPQSFQRKIGSYRPGVFGYQLLLICNKK